MTICKYIFSCIIVIGLYIFLGYSYFTKYKIDQPSYKTIRNLQIFCLIITIINYIFVTSDKLSPDELTEYYENKKAFIIFIHILSLLYSIFVLSFYWMVKKRRGNFTQYQEILINK